MPLRERLARGFWVNDRLDVALSTGAAGVIWAKCRLPVEMVAEWRRSAAAWNSGSAYRAIRWKRRARPMSLALNYIFFGPVFASRQKRHSARRKESSGSARCAARCAFRARDRRPSRLKMQIRFAAGVAGVAAIRLFQESEDVSAVVSRLRE